MNQDALVGELRSAVERRQALCIAGAGVTIAATGEPDRTSWVGLLKSGLDLCADVGQGVVNDTWIDDVAGLLTASDPASYLQAGQAIAETLRALPGNWFSKWLRQTAGSYQPVNPGLPIAIAELGIPVATTNYDDILLGAVGGRTSTWREPGRFQELLRGAATGVFHIHGHWGDPESIVLGDDSYARIVASQQAQLHLRAALAGFSTFFVGFGAGLDDPNFLQLRSWIREILVGTDYPPTVLVREADLQSAIASLHPDGIQAIAYGQDHRELELFLADLRTVLPSASASTHTYTWEETRAKLERLHLRIKRSFHPDLVLAVSGPGSFAPLYCMRVDQDETPVLTAVTFPKTAGISSANLWFRTVAASADWHHISSTKWDVFLPNALDHIPVPSRVVIFDDRVVGGNVQRMIAELLADRGHEVRRACLVASPSASAEVDWYEDETDGDYLFPWGSRRGRS